MRRVVAIAMLAVFLGGTAAAAEARRYVAELPRDGRLVLKVRDGNVHARFNVRLRCDTAPFRRRYRERRLRDDLERRRFRILFALFGDTGSGGGSSEVLEIRGRVRRGLVVGRFDYERSNYGLESVADSRCGFGPVRFRALPTR
jgi:hypothetical protein